MTDRPLSVLLASRNRKSLRQLSRFLIAFRYEVRQVAEMQRTLAAVDEGPTDFVILDAARAFDDVLDLCRRLRSLEGLEDAYLLLICRQANAKNLLDALRAGVDDFLTKPYLFCEVLSRLRTGARVLELERRLRDQTGQHQGSRLPGLAALHRRLRGELQSRGAEPRAVACAVVELDHFARVQRMHGRPAAQRLMRSVAEELQDSLSSPDDLFRLDEARLALLVHETAQAGAVEQAQRIVDLVRQRQWKAGETPLQLTASVGVARLLTGAMDPAELIAKATDALEAAKRSGGDFVAGDEEFAVEAEKWRRFAEPGAFFEDAAALDVAAPCATTLKATDTLEQASQLFWQTRLPFLVVTDEDGRLAGISSRSVVEQWQRRRAADGASPKVAELMDPDPPRFEEDAPVAAVLSSAASDTLPAVVVRQGRPTGLITANGLAELIQPLTEDTFAPERISADTEYLLVPDGS